MLHACEGNCANLKAVLGAPLQGTNAGFFQRGGKCWLIEVLVEPIRNPQDTGKPSPPVHCRLQCSEEIRWYNYRGLWIPNDPVDVLAEVVIKRTLKKTMHSFFVRATMLSVVVCQASLWTTRALLGRVSR